MKKVKSFIAMSALLAMLGTSVQNLNAQEYVSDAGGYGYEQSRRVPHLAPAIALGAIALVAIVAVAVQNSGHHGHSHSN